MSKEGLKNPELREKFIDQHIKDPPEHPDDKPINDVAPGLRNATKYKSLKPLGDPKGSRIPGKKPGQTASVTTEELAYEGTGTKNKGVKGEAHIMVQGEKTEDGKYAPEHLGGKLSVDETTGKRIYTDKKGKKFESTSEPHSFLDSAAADDQAASEKKRTRNHADNREQRENRQVRRERDLGDDEDIYITQTATRHPRETQFEWAMANGQGSVWENQNNYSRPFFIKGKIINGVQVFGLPPTP